MEKDILGQVIEAEKEIQKCLEAEKAKAQAWIESTKKELEAGFILEERNIRTSLALSEAEAVKESDRKAAEIIELASSAADHLCQVEAGTLQRLVEGKLKTILPG